LRVCDPITLFQPLPELGVVSNVFCLGAQVGTGSSIFCFETPERLELFRTYAIIRDVNDRSVYELSNR